jgi:hypothetical protein
MLSLHPVEFRVRFRKEMVQVFRDCCLDELRNGRRTGLLRLWVQALFDLVLSMARERWRTLVSPTPMRFFARGIVESTVILAIIVFHLLAGGVGITLSLPRSYETVGGFFLMSATMGAALGGLGVACSLVLTRFRRVHCRLINL